MKFSRCVSHKEKYRPCSAAMDFVGVSRRQNESGVLRGGTFFPGNHPLKVVVIMVRTNHFCRRFAINLQVQWDL
jgi:RNA-splicing ligase RtcB